jgi:dephospho-CoA kinase
VLLKKWADKFVIGLTGNIGTGKSVIRRMLEHLGAYGIDADALSHRAMAKGAPAYEPILDIFGRYLLDKDGEIDREKLGRLVFSDADALSRLEAIIHPLVEQAVDLIIRRSSQKVIVIEAIKLLESKLADYCDNIWVVYTPPEIQLHRLTNLRGMREKDARQRITNQIPQENRLARATVVIKNVSTFEDTWRQVTTAWQRHVPVGESLAVPASQPVRLSLGEVNVVRATPRQADEIKDVFNTLGGPNKNVTRDEIMAAFGEKAFMLLKVENSTMGLLGWQVENLVSRTIDILLDPALPPAQYLPIMIREMERAAGNLQCEASLIFAPKNLAMHDALWNSLGYEQREPAQLGARAWQDAAEELKNPASLLFFKQLRLDRVLRPI